MVTRLLSVIFLSASVYTPFIHAQSAPVLMQMQIQRVFIPNGFDSNDKAQVVVDSYLPNPCYKVGPHKVKVDKLNKVIKLEQWVYRYPGMICPQVIVPFTTVVDLGILDTNSYEIKDGGTQNLLGKIAIKKASNRGPDDFFYAPVSDATLDSTRKMEVALEGTFTNDCLAISEIRVATDPNDVIVVLPILKPWQETSACKPGRFPFRVTTRLPNLASGRYLLHVRSMNGQAINKVFDAEDGGE